MTALHERASSASSGALPLADDLMRGADEIRLFLFGEAEDPKQAEADRRAVYHLGQKKQLGLFKLGGVLCGRKSTVLREIEDRERPA